MRTMLSLLLAVGIASAQEKKPEANSELITLLKELKSSKDKPKVALAYAAKALRLSQEKTPNNEVVAFIEALGKEQDKEMLVPDAVPYMELAAMLVKQGRYDEAKLAVDIAEPMVRSAHQESVNKNGHFGAACYKEDWQSIATWRETMKQHADELSARNMLLESLRHENFANRFVGGGSSTEQKEKTEREMKETRARIEELQKK